MRMRVRAVLVHSVTISNQPISWQGVFLRNNYLMPGKQRKTIHRLLKIAIIVTLIVSVKNNNCNM